MSCSIFPASRPRPRGSRSIKGAKAKLIDTRKTTPGLRALQKHAVLCGGGANHRLGLNSGVMIKDNHIAVCGSIAKAVARARAGAPTLVKIEVECDTIDQVKQALDARADVIMLDNMSLAEMREAVKLVDGRIPLEASGGVKFDTVRAIAETGVDFISSSKIIQGSPAVDIGLDRGGLRSRCRRILFLVVGPSGAGKDTLLDGARAALATDDRFVFARRAITRPAEAGGEIYDAITGEEFARRRDAGGFLYRLVSA